jgi:hypothetical protein
MSNAKVHSVAVIGAGASGTIHFAENMYLNLHQSSSQALLLRRPSLLRNASHVSEYSSVVKHLAALGSTTMILGISCDRHPVIYLLILMLQLTSHELSLPPLCQLSRRDSIRHQSTPS